jgi:hypothetical protein
MQLSRTSALAALLFVALAAPAGAYALAGDDGDSGTAHHATKQDGAKQDKDDKADHSPGVEHADEASGPGRAHAEAMRKWAHCVADAASGPKAGERTGPPKERCGEKPMAPGLARHLAAGTGPFAADKGQGHGQDEQKPHAKGPRG